VGLREDKIVSQIEEVLSDLRPYFLLHGGNIQFQAFNKGTVYVKLKGACHGCPASSYTLKLMVEKTLRKEVPQVLKVEEV